MEVKKKEWMVINISLAFIAILLALALLDVELPTLGRALYALDSNDPLCIVQWDNKYTQWKDIDRCCLEARKQLACVPERQELSIGRVDWSCHTGRSVEYLLNSKALGYCTQLPIWK